MAHPLILCAQAAIGNSSGEESQGKALIDESLKQDVKFFVYSSVDRGGEERSFDTPTKIPHFVKKHHIEHHLVERTKGTTMEWTILRPTAFYENLTADFFGKVFATCFDMALKGSPLQMVAASDIGYFGADAFLHPEQYRGRGVSLAGDELTHAQMAKIFQQQTGQPLPKTFRPVCSLFMAAMKDMGYMFKWFHDEGYRADIESLRVKHPDLMNFETWLAKESDFRRR